MKNFFGSLWRRLIQRVGDSLTEPEDTDNVRVRKITVGLAGLAIIPVNLSWFVSFLSIGGELERVAIVNLILGMLDIGGAIFLFRTKNFTVYLNVLSAATLSFFVAIQIYLGGFLSSGLIIAEALLVPLLSSLLLSRWNTVLWASLSLAAFTGLLIFDGQISANAPELPANFGIVNGFFGYLTMTVFAIAIVLYLIRELEQAQEQADVLLYNILPTQIARKLKKTPGVIAQAHDQASILFADIVGFTRLTTKLPPEEMLNLLNQIYSHFDTLVEKYGVEKIRTIGDNYMAAAGVPESHPVHAQALAHMALDMIAFSQSMVPIGDVRLNFRIGINSGSLVAGVIGSKKMHYDIWSDAVNIASRMESQGVPGKIQVTGQTRELLKDEFILQPRGKMEVKGKGQMETWFLVGRKAIDDK